MTSKAEYLKRYLEGGGGDAEGGEGKKKRKRKKDKSGQEPGVVKVKKLGSGIVIHDEVRKTARHEPVRRTPFFRLGKKTLPTSSANPMRRPSILRNEPRLARAASSCLLTRRVGPRAAIVPEVRT